MIDARKIEYEDLVKLYEDKCKYCEILEERLVKTNKRNDELTERINHVLTKAKKVKDSYKELYSFAEKLCDVINKKDEQIDELLKVNDDIIKINKKMGNAVHEDVSLMLKIIQVNR